MTTTYPIKPPLYAITKATNYLPNVLMQMEAKEAGFDNGVFIDDNGHVGESSNMNVAFVTATACSAIRSSTTSCPAARRCGLSSRPRLKKQGRLIRRRGVATSRSRTHARHARWCCSAAR